MSIFSKSISKKGTKTFDWHIVPYNLIAFLSLLYSIEAYMQHVLKLYFFHMWYTPLSLTFLSVLLLLLGYTLYRLSSENHSIMKLTEHRTRLYKNVSITPQASAGELIQFQILSPITLELRPNWWNNVKITALIFTILTCTNTLPVFTIQDFAFGNYSYISSNAILFTTLLNLPLALLWGLIYFTFARASIILHINQDGIQKTFSKKSIFIPWNEAEFFATWQNTNRATHFYELHSANQVITWIHPQSHHKGIRAPHYVARDQQTFDVQIRLVVETIKKRTGLQLTDLNEAQN